VRKSLGQNTFYRGVGTGGQGLWVIPDADLVVVHRGDTDHGRRIDGEDHWGLVESVLAARRSEPDPKPDLRLLQPTVLASQLPPATMPKYRALPEPVLDDYLVIQLPSGRAARVREEAVGSVGLLLSSGGRCVEDGHLFLA
jgi:hypothetical protein